MHDDPVDVLLREYLAAVSESEADRPLARILDEIAAPMVRRIVASAAASVALSDGEDVVADTLADLLRRLRDLRAGASGPIYDFRAYVACCAYNRCHEQLRRRHPARNRLRNQLQYLCAHDPRFALWRGGGGELVCGLAAWKGREPAGGADGILDLPARSDPAARDRAQVVTLAAAVLRESGGPLALDALVAIIGGAIGLDVQRAEPADDVPAPPSPEVELMTRATLRQMWSDVRRLSQRQRLALLLNLRDVRGRECLSLLPLTRTATIAEIAEAVEMPPQRFAALWNDLPLSDAAIAELLDVTPRQVVKLRRLARERLQRMAEKHDRRNFSFEFHPAIRTSPPLCHL